jgi:hypothetical protein
MTLELKIGKYYLDGNGDVQGPTVKNTDKNYSFMAGGRTYTFSGIYSIYEHRPERNLIREVNPDGSEIAPVPEYDPVKFITLNPHEIESGLNRVVWAELLIRQLPEDHEGRNSWLMNYARPKLAKKYTMPRWGELPHARNYSSQDIEEWYNAIREATAIKEEVK